MNIYIIFLSCLLTLTFRELIPYMITWWKRFITRISRKKNTHTQVDCSMLEQRVAELEKKVAKRHNNDRAAIREEIKNVLIKLKQ